MSLEDWAHVAEIVGGFATAVGIGLAVWGVRKTLPQQIEAFQKTRHAQRKEEVAQGFFLAASAYANGLLSSVTYVAKPIGVLPFEPIVPKGRPDLKELEHRVWTTWAVARLHGLDDDVGDLIGPLLDLDMRMMGVHESIFDASQSKNADGEIDPALVPGLTEEVDAFFGRVYDEVERIATALQKVIRHEVPMLTKPDTDVKVLPGDDGEEHEEISAPAKQSA